MTVTDATSAYSTLYSRTSSVSQDDSLSELIAQRIAESDTNGDEALSLEESGIEEELFSSMDSDSDGLLTSSEVLAYIESMKLDMTGAAPPSTASIAKDLIESLDTDEDGALSLEGSGASEEKFNAADTNEDGIVTQDELEAAMQNGLIAMAPGNMASAPNISSLNGLSSYQKQQDDALLERLKGDEEDSTLASIIGGQGETKSVNLVA
jgi:hypothetical protein